MFLGNFTLGSIISAGSIIREDRVRSSTNYYETKPRHAVVGVDGSCSFYLMKKKIGCCGLPRG